MEEQFNKLMEAITKLQERIDVLEGLTPEMPDRTCQTCNYEYESIDYCMSIKCPKSSNNFIGYKPQWKPKECSDPQRECDTCEHRHDLSQRCLKSAIYDHDITPT
jgi:hypothetical protein